jgi:4-amino-4-deoxy-L-arabinose transferase-like glycosyltransferase
LSWYPKFWAPLYPSALWAISRTGFPVERTNTVFYTALLVMVAAFLRRHVGRRQAFLAVLLLAVLEPAAWNLRQLMAETLFMLQAMAVLAILARYRERPSATSVVLAALLTAISALTRYFGFFWPVLPLAVALALGPQPRKLARLAIAAAVLVVTTLPWLVYVHAVTGHWSGAVRDQSAQVPMTGRPNDALTSTIWTGKTLLVDLLSPTRVARLGVIQNDPVTRGEWAMLVFVAPSLILIGVGLVLRLRTRSWPASLARVRALPALFAATYLVALIIVWSTANTDPINSRFLYPSYPFLVMTGFVAARAAGTRWRDRLPYLHLYGVVLAMSLLRQVALVAAPSGP